MPVAAVIPAALSVAGGVMGAIGSDSKDDAASASWDKWAAMQKPTAAEKEAMRKRGMMKIDKDFLGANKQLSNTLAAKGLGGGMLGAGLADNTRAKEAAYGDLETQVELFGAGKAPSTPPPTNLDTGDYFLSNLGNMSSFMGGMGMSSGGMFKGMF